MICHQTNTGLFSGTFLQGLSILTIIMENLQSKTYL